jgi:NAD(P)-dependent dehydrogenase (short-subunit alcohol dehydrogenase family)
MTRPSSASDIPDQTGRTALVTGASSGIGRAAAALAARGAHVILAVRDLARGEAVAQTIGSGVEVRHLDLSSLASVRELAAGVEEPLDYLVNNAGMMSATRDLTSDGFESQLGFNHLGHFALTNLLLDRVTERVVTISSVAHKSAEIDFDDLQWERRRYDPFGAYGQSKLANLLFTAELQRLLASGGVNHSFDSCPSRLGSDGIRHHQWQPPSRSPRGNRHAAPGAWTSRLGAAHPPRHRRRRSWRLLRRPETIRGQRPRGAGRTFAPSQRTGPGAQAVDRVRGADGRRVPAAGRHGSLSTASAPTEVTAMRPVPPHRRAAVQ